MVDRNWKLKSACYLGGKNWLLKVPYYRADKN